MKAAVLILQIVYFSAGAAAQFPGLFLSPTAPTASSPPERYPRREPKEFPKGHQHCGGIKASWSCSPLPLYIEASFRAMGWLFTTYEKKLLCFLPSLTKHQCLLDLGALWGFSPAMGSDLTWEITVCCCKQSDSNAFPVLRWEKM